MPAVLPLIDLLVLLLCLTAVAVFAGYVFPRQIAADGEVQVPRKFVSMLMFVGLNLVVFIAVALLILSAQYHEGMRALLALILESGGLDRRSLEQHLQTESGRISAVEALVGGLAAYYALFGFRRGRLIATGALQQLHSVNLIDEDVEKVDARLRVGTFAPKQDDADLARLVALEQRVSEAAAEDPGRALAVKCAKLEALLGLWTRRDEWRQTLPRDRAIDLDVIRAAAARRKMLALQIGEQVERVQNGEVDPGVLNEIIELISRHETEAQSVIEAIRARVRGDGGLSDASLRVILTPVIAYLDEEYDAALAVMTRATATSLVMSGDAAGERLDQLRAAGFQGLGRFDPIDPHVAVAITAGIFIAVFVVLLVYSYWRGVSAPNMWVLGAFTGSLTLATITGVMVGGLRTLARRARAPFGWYVVAGVVVAVLHFLLVVSVEIVSVRFGQAAGERITNLLLIGTGIPVAIAVTICLLARKPEVRPLRMPAGVWDGLRMAAILGAVALASIVLAVTTQNLTTPDTQAGTVELFARLSALIAVIGLIIGLPVIGRVRQAALARLVEEAPDQPAPPARAAAPSAEPRAPKIGDRAGDGGGAGAMPQPAG